MCVFVWVKSIMLIIVISEWSNYEWKRKSGCFCLHRPRCWMVRYQQLALGMLVLTKSRQAETCLSSSEFYSCVVFTSLLREQTHLWMISWVLPPIICAIYLAFCQHVVPKSFFFCVIGSCQHCQQPPFPLRPLPPRMPSVCAWRVLTLSWWACRQLLRSGVKLFITKWVCQHVLWN